MIGNLRLIWGRPLFRPVNETGMQRAVRRFFRWRRSRQGLEALRNMPDYLLRDIGITRFQADHFLGPDH